MYDTDDLDQLTHDYKRLYTALGVVLLVLALVAYGIYWLVVKALTNLILMGL